MRTVPFLMMLVAGACAAPQKKTEEPSRSGAQESVERLSVTLLDLAARRVDLSTVRAAIVPFHGERGRTATTAPAAVAPRGEDVAGRELEREFELALANRLNLVESPRDEGELPLASGDDAGAPPAPHIATHALVGEYTARDGTLVLSVRLVDLESRLVLSAARDTLPLSWFSPRARAQLEPPPAKKSTVVASERVAERLRGPVVVTPQQQQAAPVASPGLAPASAAPIETPKRPTPTTAPVEDFETWRARRAGEPVPASSNANATGNPAQPPPGSPAPSAAPPRSAAPQAHAAGAAEAFPWREDGWLAELLRIPKETQARVKR